MQRRIISGKNTDQRTELYVLKHKDKEIAIVQMDVCTGRLKRAAEVLLPEELPAGCGADGSRLPEWWENRAIPDSRIGLQHVLAGAGMQTNLSLMLSSYGLSLTDHYWMQPAERKLYWKDLNFYENIFSDVLGNLLTDTEETGRKNALPGNLSPSFSVNGDMKKKWVIREGARCLLKVTSEYYGQQSVNELIAVRLHERLSWDHYVPYRIEYRKIRGTEYPCSLSPMFTSEEREFVSVYQLLLDYKIPNESSLYEALISRAVQSGMEEERVRRQLEYSIMTDFILSNTDRHLNNMGFLYDSKRRFFCGMAPGLRYRKFTALRSGGEPCQDQSAGTESKFFLQMGERSAPLCKEQLNAESGEAEGFSGGSGKSASEIYRDAGEAVRERLLGRSAERSDISPCSSREKGYGSRESTGDGGNRKKYTA